MKKYYLLLAILIFANLLAYFKIRYLPIYNNIAKNRKVIIFSLIVADIICILIFFGPEILKFLKLT